MEIDHNIYVEVIMRKKIHIQIFITKNFIHFQSYSMLVQVSEENKYNIKIRDGHGREFYCRRNVSTIRR